MFRAFFWLLITIPSLAHSEIKQSQGYAIPNDSPLSFHRKHALFENLYFNGEAKIFVYYEIKNQLLTVFPDHESMKLLPFLSNNTDTFKPDKISIKSVKWIQGHDSNQKSELKKLIMKLSTLGKKQKNHNGDDIIVGNAEIIIDNYYAGFECDTPFFLAHIKEVVSATKETRYIAKTNSDGCK